MEHKIARGIRNNNPLNIRYGSNWKGMHPNSKLMDSQFCVFTRPWWGFRAAFITLRTYYNVHKCRTLSQIITRWAPPSENATVKYIKTVSERTGIDPNETLPPISMSHFHWIRIVLAMAYVECGKLPSDYRHHALMGISMI